MKRILMIATVSEIATGAALLITPSLVGQLLLGDELIGVAVPVARVLGIALVGLGVACWATPRTGMLVYVASVPLYLTYLGFIGAFVGILLWPAVVAHLILAVFLIERGQFKN
jgi:hypothetical protein